MDGRSKREPSSDVSTSTGWYLLVRKCVNAHKIKKTSAIALRVFLFVELSVICIEHTFFYKVR